MRKYYCYFEDLRKNTYFQVRHYNPNGVVKLSLTAYQGKDNVIEVCMTKEEARELVLELNDYIKRV